LTRHVKLFTPGPGDVDDEVLSALAQPVIRHYGPEWMEIYEELLTLLREVFRTQNSLFVVPGPASALMDMAVGSLVPSGGKIIVGTNGFFGDRIVDIARGYNADVIPFVAAHDQPLDPARLRQIMKDHPEAQVVSFVHHETSTTVMNPLKELAAAVRDAGKIVVVDTVSSMGGVEIDVDGWGVDVCVTGPNKCLESVPGVGFISVSERAWDLIDRSPAAGHGWYLDLRTWRKYEKEWGSWHPSPVTLPVNIILGVLTSLRKIAARGLPAHFARFSRASRAMRTGLQNVGFEMYVEDEFASPIVTGVRARPEFEVADLMKWLAEERGMAIGGGLGPLKGKIFRVGHLGQAAEREYLLDFLYAIEEFLRLRGFETPVGAAVSGMETFITRPDRRSKPVEILGAQ
jgi:alanine-glyoxylate transaminase/serine-glyoxylate transaminase/serine-pyruvate transaminase